MAVWSVYLVRTARDELYSGITVDVGRRFAEHAEGRGAKFLRGRGPLELAYVRRVGAHGLALRVERRLKQLARREKELVARARPSRKRLLALLRVEDAAAEERGAATERRAARRRGAGHARARTPAPESRLSR